MTKLLGILFINALAALASIGQPASLNGPQLPEWRVLEFEQKAFWATARSRIEVLPVSDDTKTYELDVQSSVVNNLEQIRVKFEPATGRAITRSRFTQGKQRRVKTYEYEADFIIRERRNSVADSDVAPQDWPTTSRNTLVYPESATKISVTTPYMLLVLAQRLQEQGPGRSIDVLVHTDLNFYSVHLSSGNGIPVDVDYEVIGQGNVVGTRETLAVVIRVKPETTLKDEDDFRLLGLNGELILLFDHESGLPLQIRGQAPRIGPTKINLKSVTMWGPEL